MIKEIKLEGNKKIKHRRSAGRAQDPAAHAPRRREDPARASRKPRSSTTRRATRTPRSPSRPPSRWAAKRSRSPSHVDEGKIVRIQHIIFEGNQDSQRCKLRSIMQTKEASILSVLSPAAGNLDHEVLKTDVERLTAFYYDNGYVDVKVDEPQIERKEDGLDVTIKIDEGEQYQCRHREARRGRRWVTGRSPSAHARDEERRSVSARASCARTSSHSPKATAIYGYAFVNVEPLTDIDPTKKPVDITYKIDKGPEVYFDRIEITRQHQDQGQGDPPRAERAGAAALLRHAICKPSQARVQRLGSLPGRQHHHPARAISRDKIDLLVDVKEGRPAAFTAGAGFSSGDRSCSTCGSPRTTSSDPATGWCSTPTSARMRRNFTLDFTEPYFFDTLLHLASFYGIQLAARIRRLQPRRHRLPIQALYPFTALGVRGMPFSAPRSTRCRFGIRVQTRGYRHQQRLELHPRRRSIDAEEAGRHAQRAASIPTLVRNTLNHPFDPTDGSIQDFSVEFAGLGAGTSS